MDLLLIHRLETSISHLENMESELSEVTFFRDQGTIRKLTVSCWWIVFIHLNFSPHTYVFCGLLASHKFSSFVCPICASSPSQNVLACWSAVVKQEAQLWGLFFKPLLFPVRLEQWVSYVSPENRSLVPSVLQEMDWFLWNSPAGDGAPLVECQSSMHEALVPP